MVKVLMAIGDKDKALILADIYTGQAATQAKYSLELAIAFQKQQLDDYALTCYKNALRLAPNSAKISRQIGFYYLSKGDEALGREYLVRSFQLDPVQPDVAGKLGELGVAVKIPKRGKASGRKMDKMFNRANEGSK